jgi:hypothetical protein
VLTHTDTRITPTEINYQFNLPDYCQHVGNELFMNMQLTKPVYDEYDIKADRTIPIDIEFASKQACSVLFKLDADATVEFMPADDSYNYNDKFGYTIHYAKTPAGLLMKRSIFINVISIEGADIEAFNKMLTQLKKKYSESVSIKL